VALDARAERCGGGWRTRDGVMRSAPRTGRSAFALVARLIDAAAGRLRVARRRVPNQTLSVSRPIGARSSNQQKNRSSSSTRTLAHAPLPPPVPLCRCRCAHARVEATKMSDADAPRAGSERKVRRLAAHSRLSALSCRASRARVTQRRCDLRAHAALALAGSLEVAWPVRHSGCAACSHKHTRPHWHT
jgi:hypothetical protein